MKIALEGKDKVVEIPDGLSPQEVEKQCRSYYTPDELYGSTTFGEREQYRLKKGRSQVTGGKAFWSAMQGGQTEEEAYKTWNINTADFTPENDEKYSARNFGETLVGATTELAPYMLDSSLEGMKYSAYFGAAAATAAIVGGQMGPQAALPEEIITAPAAYMGGRAIGQVYGAWMNAAQVEGGMLYKELRDNNISPEIAKQWAIPAGYAIGAVELMQIQQIIPGFGKLGRKGITELVKQAMQKGETPLAKKIASFSGRFALNMGKFMASEVPEEIIQENIQMVAAIYAAAADEESGYAGPTDEEIIKRNVETFKQAMLSFPLLGLPGTVYNTMRSTNKESRMVRGLTARAKEALNLDLSTHIEDALQYDNFTDYMNSLDEKVDDRYAQNYGFDNRVLFADAVWDAGQEILEQEKSIKKIAAEKPSEGPSPALQSAIDRAMDLAQKLGVVIDSVEYVDEEMLMDPADPMDIQSIIAHGYTEREINDAIKNGERFIITGEYKTQGQEGESRRTSVRFFRGATEQDAYHEIVVHGLEDQGGLPGWVGSPEEHARFLEGIIAAGNEATIIELTEEGRRINRPVRDIEGKVQNAIRLVNDAVQTIDVGEGAEIVRPSGLFSEVDGARLNVNKEIKTGTTPAKIIDTRSKTDMSGQPGWTQDIEGKHGAKGDWRNAEGKTYTSWYAEEMAKRMRDGAIEVVQDEKGDLYFTSPGLPAYKYPKPLKTGNVKVKTYILDMPAVYTCKNCVGCAATCYAVGAQIQYPDTKLGRFANLYMFMNHRETFHSRINEELRENEFTTVRMHSSGDIFSQKYLAFLENIVKENPDKTFYVYTKVGAYDYESIDQLPNFNRVNSILPDGQKNYGDMAYIKKASKEFGIKICPASVAKEGVKVICADKNYKGKGVKCSQCTRESYMLFQEHGSPQRAGAAAMIQDIRDTNFMEKIQHSVRKVGPAPTEGGKVDRLDIWKEKRVRGEGAEPGDVDKAAELAIKEVEDKKLANSELEDIADKYLDMIVSGTAPTEGGKGVGEYQHILRKGTDIEKLKKEGFKSGIGPNVLFRWDGEPTDIMQNKYAPKEGDSILYIPKEWIKQTGNGPKIKDGFIPTDENIVKFSPTEGGKVIEAVRTGELDKDGGYFATQGSSTYYDPEGGAEKYKITGAKIATSGTPEMRTILEKAKATATPEELKRINSALEKDNKTDNFVDYMLFDEVPSIKQAAEKLGYDGVKIWENDDITDPSSIFLWNTKKASKLSPTEGGQSAQYAIRKIKSNIHKVTGVEKDKDLQDEYQQLKRLFKRMEDTAEDLHKQAEKEKAANVKWTEAGQKLADDMSSGKKLAQAKAREKKLEGFREKLKAFAIDNLKGEDRGKFLTAVADIKTERTLDKAMEKVKEVAEASAKKDMLRRIKQQVKRITKSKSISIDYVQKIEELVNEFELTGHTAKTIARLEATQAFLAREAAAGKIVDLPSGVLAELEILARKPAKELTLTDLVNIHEKVRALADLGKTKLRTRKAAIALMKERDLIALKKDSKSVTSKKVKEDNAISGRLTGVEKVTNSVKKVMNLAQMKDLMLHPIDALFDFLDGQKDYTGANYRIFKRRIDVAFSMYLDMKAAITMKIDKLANDLDLDTDSMERIGVYAAKMQEGGMDKLLAFFTEEQVESVVLTNEEMKFYNAMRDELDKLRLPIEKVMREVYNQPLGTVRNYFPFLTDFDAMSAAEMRDRFGDKIITMSDTLKKNVEMGFTLTRKGGKNRIKINAAEIFGKHVDNAVYLITVGKETKYLGELAAREEYAEAVGDVGQEIVREWIDLLARKGISQGDRLAALDFARKYTGIVALGFKLSSALVQVSALMDGAAMIGTHAFDGFQKILTNSKWRSFVIENMPEIRARIGDDIAFQDFGKDAFAKKLGDMAYKPLQTIDRLTATGVAAGAYIKWCKDNNVPIDLDNPDPEGIEYAQKMGRRTQSSSQFKDLPMAITKGKLTGNISVDKLLLQFQSFMLNRWSLIRHDVWRAGIMGKNKKQAASIMMWLVAANFAEIGIRRWTKEMLAGLMGQELPEDDEDKEFYKNLGQVMQNVPFMGSIFYAMLYEDFPVPAVSMTAKIVGKFGAAIKAEDDKGLKFIKALLAAAPGGQQIEPMVKGE